MGSPRSPEPMPPFIAWMSRYGILVIGLLVLLEFLLHGWTLYSSRHERAAAEQQRVEQRDEPAADGAQELPFSQR